MIPVIALQEACAVAYATLCVLILWRARNRTSLMLSACCAVTAGWAAYTSWDALETAGVAGAADLVRALAWFGFLFYLYRDARLGQPLHEAGFAAAALMAAAGGLCIEVMPSLPISLESPVSTLVAVRLLLAIVELLLIENLYFNLPPDARWHVALPSVLLGALACFDIALCADLVLYHQSSIAMVGARTIVMILIAPVLVVAAARGQRWKGRVRLSRTAVFHSATLILSGGVLVALAAMGEALRLVDGSWSWLVEVSVAFVLAIGVGLLMTSAAARSRFQRIFVEHFFAERYDYRRQWLSCIRTLSGDDGDIVSALPTRVIRAMGSVVDSPAGILFLRDGGTGALSWAGSWNMPGTDVVPADHPVLTAVRGGNWIARLDGEQDAQLRAAPLASVTAPWLAIPLLHRSEVVGLVVMTRPRAPFTLEQEVFDLLRIVAQEVSTYLAEQRATQTLLQTRDLHDYSKRFAFVAHDIKNVSSQLALLVANAQSHISNPEFQQDMIETVQSSVRKIGALLERLERPEVDRAPAALAVAARLEALVGTYRRVRHAGIVLEHDGSTGTVSMGIEAFEASMTHLLNNAVEAGGARPVRLRVRHEARQVVVDVVDSGPGMTAEFVREQLFRPFTTSKAGGSGIGAFQARELVREAGGDLVALSKPGQGTTMRILLPRTDVSPAAPPADPRVQAGVAA